MAITRIVSYLVVAVAMAIAVIGKFRPQLFLKLPFGFIPWAITGNHMPPYFDAANLYKENWRGQKGDVVLSSGGKAGTLWLQNIVLLLRSNGWDDFDEMSDHFDTSEMLAHPDDTLNMRMNETDWKRAIAKAKGFYGFQIFTHKFPGEDSKLFGLDPDLNPQVKYLAVVRNGKEVLKSFLPFLNGHTEKFRRMWGGFPPKMGGPGDVLKFVVDDMPDFYFGHLLAWWKRKDLPNVLLLHYRTLRQDPSNTIQQIAAFLEIELTPQLLAQVLHKSSLQYMTHPSRTIKYTSLVGYPNDRFSIVEEYGHIRPGGGNLDNGEGFFTEEMTRKWEAAIQKQFGHDPALVDFANSGVLRAG
jgi:hypothetical protein